MWRLEGGEVDGEVTLHEATAIVTSLGLAAPRGVLAILDAAAVMQ